jgi:hypothetical protein
MMTSVAEATMQMPETKNISMLPDISPKSWFDSFSGRSQNTSE